MESAHQGNTTSTEESTNWIKLFTFKKKKNFLSHVWIVKDIKSKTRGWSFIQTRQKKKNFKVSLQSTSESNLNSNVKYLYMFIIYFFLLE